MSVRSATINVSFGIQRIRNLCVPLSRLYLRGKSLIRRSLSSFFILLSPFLSPFLGKARIRFSGTPSTVSNTQQVEVGTFSKKLPEFIKPPPRLFRSWSTRDTGRNQWRRRGRSTTLRHCFLHEDSQRLFPFFETVPSTEKFEATDDFPEKASRVHAI